MKDMCHYILSCFYHNAIIILLHVSIEIRLTNFTVGTSISSTTFAYVSVHCISACSAVQTWIAVALDNVYDKQLQFWWLKRIYNAAVQTYMSQLRYDDYYYIFNSTFFLFRVCTFRDKTYEFVGWIEADVNHPNLYIENNLILTTPQGQKKEFIL